MSKMTEFKTKIPLKDKLHFAWQFSSLFTIRLAAILLGFIVVPVALLFKKKVKARVPMSVILPSGKALTVDYVIHLPKFAWLFDNAEEGCASTYAPYWIKCKGKADSYWNMVFWSCIRNPANNLRFTKLLQLDMLLCDHEYKKFGNSFYCKSTNLLTGKIYYTFRRRKWYEYKGQQVSSILHLGFKALEYSLNKVQANPDLLNIPSERYKGFSFQLIPRRGFRKV